MCVAELVGKCAHKTLCVADLEEKCELVARCAGRTQCVAELAEIAVGYELVETCTRNAVCS